jgi:hypothetical protein
MSDRADDRWAIARLLFTTHLPFLLLCWAVFAAAVVALTFALDLRVDLDRSVWDPAVSVARWFALGYGVYLVNRLLPVFVAHGRTRREFAASIAVFMVAASAMVAALRPAAGRLRRRPGPRPAGRDALALCLAGLLPGVAVTWVMVRDIPLRNRVA